jgi:predicted esterase
MPPRIPTDEDFASLSPSLTISLAFPSPRESTTAFLILFHGLGDCEEPFATFAKTLALPGVLAISVRGTSPIPSALLGDPADSSWEATASARHFHWGDDLKIDTSTGDLDADPGFKKAADLVLEILVRETLLRRCGWELSDILLFGFGQGGSLALGLASQLRLDTRFTGGESGSQPALKGVISIGGSLPSSMVPTVSTRSKSKTIVLLCQVWDEDEVDRVKDEFAQVKAIQWKRRDIAMPRDREEVLPLMQFFGERLRSGW